MYHKLDKVYIEQETGNHVLDKVSHKQAKVYHVLDKVYYKLDNVYHKLDDKVNHKPEEYWKIVKFLFWKYLKRKFIQRLDRDKSLIYNSQNKPLPR